MKTPAHLALHSSVSSQWYTPPETIELVRNIIGQIAFDPASCALANRIVRADRYCNGFESNGLEYQWPDRWFCNPPYSKKDGGPCEPWVRKAVDSQTTGIMLLNATPDRGWFKLLWQWSTAICFLYDRVRFCEPISQAEARHPTIAERRPQIIPGVVRGPSPTHGNVLVLFCSDRRVSLIERFTRQLAAHGKVVGNG